MTLKFLNVQKFYTTMLDCVYMHKINLILYFAIQSALHISVGSASVDSTNCGSKIFGGKNVTLLLTCIM